MSGWTKRCEDLSGNLLKAKKYQDVTYIDRLLERIDKFKTECNRIKKTHKDHANELWNLEFHTLEDIRAARIAVKNLMGIYIGQDMDMDDLTVMDTQLGQFERDITIWNDSSIPNKELQDRVFKRIAEIRENQDNDDEPPPWDSEEVYNNFLNHILKERRKAADKWIEKVQVSSEEIRNLSAQKCQSLLNRIKSKPAYMDDGYLSELKDMQKMLERRLDSLEIEGLLVRFRQLPVSLQKEFLKLAISEVN